MIEHYLKELISQGITFIPRWSPPAAEEERAPAPGDIPLDPGAAGTSREPPASPCPAPEPASPDGRHSARSLFSFFFSFSFLWASGFSSGVCGRRRRESIFFFLSKINNVTIIFLPKTKKLCRQYVLELRKKLGLIRPLRCLQYAGIKYFICSKINILGDRFGWVLTLYQAKTSLRNVS